MKELKEYHRIWLAVHPERTEEWLRRMFKEGFHIHHLDGNHYNNIPNNLILIEAGDHFLLHNGVKRMLFIKRTGKSKRKKIKQKIRVTGCILKTIKDKKPKNTNWGFIAKRKRRELKARLLKFYNEGATTE
jgi:hypothetical protein